MHTSTTLLVILFVAILCTAVPISKELQAKGLRLNYGDPPDESSVLSRFVERDRDTVLQRYKAPVKVAQVVNQRGPCQDNKKDEVFHPRSEELVGFQWGQEWAKLRLRAGVGGLESLEIVYEAFGPLGRCYPLQRAQDLGGLRGARGVVYGPATIADASVSRLRSRTGVARLGRGMALINREAKTRREVSGVRGKPGAHRAQESGEGESVGERKRIQEGPGRAWSYQRGE
ncbi:hypothetical protein EDB89DRAFT_2239452 [Lactarius sanguifluus]|nr:hypothetical protein EDB89DRAFT_2239452 [Lactarius sanguifluus]